MQFIYNPLGMWTLMKREVHRFLKVYLQTVISPLISNLLYLAIFGGTLSSRHITIGHVGYLKFLVPGLCVMGVILSSFQNPSFSIVAHKFQNTIMDFNSYPLSHFEKLVGFIFGGTCRGILIGGVTYLATIPFAGAWMVHPIWFFISLVFVGITFSAIGVISGLCVKTFEGTNFFLSIILTPITYLAGVFFQVSSLPGVLSKIALFNPLFPLVSSVRYMYLGVSEGNIVINISYALGVMFFFCIVAYIFIQKGIGLKY